jgi:small conductance mechanosensitive channel
VKIVRQAAVNLALSQNECQNKNPSATCLSGGGLLPFSFLSVIGLMNVQQTFFFSIIQADSSHLFLVPALIAASLLICAAFHWMISRWQARWLSRLTVSDESDLQAPPVRKLLIDWSARALRLLVWLLFLVLVLQLLPRAEEQLLSVPEKLLAKLQQADSFLINNGIPALIAGITTIFLMRFAAALIRAGFDTFERRVATSASDAARRRSRTLSAISRAAAQAVILFIGMMVVLSHLGFSIAPILASAGIVGIAVGFGAQSLVKDIFAGFLILLEEQYDLGDTVKIGENIGTVENLTLRVTRIRGLDGALTTIPNGSITTVSNLSRDWSRVVLDVEIDYQEDADRAMKLMLETAREMRTGNPLEITEEPSLLGMEKIQSGHITLRLTMKTAPAKHGEILRELRRRLKLTFEREGIKVPTGKQEFTLVSQPEQLTSK